MPFTIDALSNNFDRIPKNVAYFLDFIPKSLHLPLSCVTIESLRKPEVLNKLLQALAFQVGSEVSYNELAQTVGTDSKTVEK